MEKEDALQTHSLKQHILAHSLESLNRNETTNNPFQKFIIYTYKT